VGGWYPSFQSKCTLHDCHPQIVKEFYVLSTYNGCQSRCDCIESKCDLHFYAQIVKDYYGKEEITPQDLMEARLTGMGPKGQRRVYKKKGSRADSQISSSRTRSETEGDSSGDDEGSGRGGGADGNKRASESVNAGRREGGKIQEGEESLAANSTGDDAGGPRGGEGLDPAGQGEYSHRLVGSSSNDADSRSGERGEENVKSGDDAAGGVLEGRPRLPGSSVVLDRGEENGRDEIGTVENGLKARHGEATERADRAHSHSRRNGILSRRQRQKLRAQQAENNVYAMGGGEKGKRAEAVLGHGQHGRRVVEILEQTGGEDALREFVQEWRACFVEALRPNFLPPAWDVKHRWATGLAAYGARPCAG
jgi:hypothetical protein